MQAWARDPSRLASIGAGAQFAGFKLAKKINHHIVKIDFAGSVGRDAFKDFEHFAGFDHQGGFFESFALGGVAESFAELN